MLSGDGGWQVIDVDFEEKGCQDRSLWDAGIGPGRYTVS